MNKFRKTLKNITAGALAATVLTAGAVFATDTDTLSINGTLVEDAQVIEVDGATFVPVRALCESLGMEVLWDNEAEMVTIVDMPIYVTFSPEADGYTFARTAPMQLGSAPFLHNDRTYVPIRFIDEILKKEFTISEGGDVNVTAVIDNSVGAVVIGSEKTENGTSITVFDSKRNEEVVANITNETVITDEEGNALTADVLVENAEIRIEYAEFMTMSIPPMTNAVKIQFLGVIEQEEAVAEDAKVVTILEKNESEDGVTITVFDSTMNSDVVINITDETAIADKNGNALTVNDLAMGKDVEVEYAEFMTMSIPPITNAVSVKVVEEKATVTVMDKDAEAKTITVFDKDMRMPLVLNVSDETVITDKEGNAVSFDKIARGTELAEIEHSEAMTKSLPPITNATKIVIEK